jgi:hypothetical protein
MLYKSTRQKDHRHRCVLRYGVLLSSSFHVFGFFILIFHLKQKHEEGERLLHYLQHTHTALATRMFCICNISKTVDIKLNIYNSEFSLRISQESVTLWLLWRLFVTMRIIYVMFILDIICVPFPFLRHCLPEVKGI